MDQKIADFVNSKNIAVVGVSDRKFGGTIYKTLKKRGYHVFPVHPTKQLFDGDTCVSSLKDLSGQIDAALIVVSAAQAEMVVDDAVQSGITKIWFQQGPNFAASEKKALAQGVQTVSGKCILMYAEPVSGIHAFHRFLARLIKKY